MATRQETQQRKTALRQRLITECQSGTLVVGQALPSLRLLAAEHGLSVTLAALVVQELVREGVLHTRSTAGTFVGPQQNEALECFLLMMPYSPPAGGFLHQLQMGFEARVSELGGASLVLTKEDAFRYYASGDLPPVAGVFAFRPAYWPEWPREIAGSDSQSSLPATWGVPFVGFDDVPADFDSTRFDDFDGGRQAARHLLRLGHRRIAFLGLHENETDPFWRWSFERQHGWSAALSEAGVEPAAHAFKPHHAPTGTDPREQVGAARQAAHALARRSDITAVIAVNEHAMSGLLEALREASVPAAKWPALVHFDDAASPEEHVISTVRLPWDALGRTAAEVLSNRRSRRETGPFQTHLVPMRLIPRLTCRSGWAQSSTFASHRVSGNPLALPVLA